MFWKKKKKETQEYTFPDTLKVANYSKCKQDVAQYIRIILNKIYGYNTVNLAVINNERVLNQLSTDDIEMQAILYPTYGGFYQLVIRERPNTDIATIIAHEMIHMNQYLRGDLKISTDKKHFTWKGKAYDNSTKYNDRPWEKEAFQDQTKLKMQMLRMYYA